MPANTSSPSLGAHSRAEDAAPSVVTDRSGVARTPASDAEDVPPVARTVAQWVRRALEAAWGARALAFFALVAAAIWPWVVLAPSRTAARAVARIAAKILLAASGIPVSTTGIERWRELDRPCVFVANHSGEIDSIAVLAALPFDFAFVAKDELRRSFLTRWPLARLDTLFVKRRGPSTVPSQTERAVGRLRRGSSLFFFPEGTFRRAPGLLGFHRGAFVAAALAGVPVVPVAIVGTRGMTPGDRRLPRRGSIRIDVGAPLRLTTAAGPTAAAAALRRLAREHIATRIADLERAPA